MKHLLFISWWWPYPANNGSNIRIYNLLRHLSQQYEVTLLSFADAGEATPEQIERLRGFCTRVEAVAKPVYQPGALKALLGYFSPLPRSLIDVYSPEMAEKVRLLNTQHPADVFVVSQLQTIRYLDVLPRVPAVMEEAEVTVFYDKVARSTGRVGRFRAQLTLTKLENTLKKLLVRGVAFTVVSESERTYLRRFAPADARIEVVPNGVDTQANQPDAAVQPEPNSLIYTGAVTYDANLDAVDYFVREALPLVRQKVPAAHLTVTGGTGNIDVSQLKAQPGVTFSGYLPSVADKVRESWVMVAPLRIGGGTRLKILEAMALGTPVISTRKGAEGLNTHDGEDILLADTPQQLADGVCRLLAEPALRAKLAAGGRALVEREYDWSVISQKLTSLIQNLPV